MIISLEGVLVGYVSVNSSLSLMSTAYHFARVASASLCRVVVAVCICLWCACGVRAACVRFCRVFCPLCLCVRKGSHREIRISHSLIYVFLLKPRVLAQLKDAAENPEELPSSEQIADWKKCALDFVKSRKTSTKSRAPPQRVASYKNIAAWDNAVQVVLGCGLGDPRFVDDSLLDYDEKRKAGVSVRGDREVRSADYPETKGIVTISLDQASNNLAAIFFMQFVCRLFLHPLFDLFHREWNDLKLILADASLYGFSLLFITANNCVFGPWSSCMWFQTIVQGYCKYLNVATLSDPLFLHLLPLLLYDRGQRERLTEPGIEEETWHSLRESLWLQAKGIKASLGRWFTLLEAIEEGLPEWHLRLLVLLYLGHLLGFATRSDDATVASAFSTARKSTPTTASSRRITASNKPIQDLRRRCKNTLHLCLVFYSDIKFNYFARIMKVMTKPLHNDFSSRRKFLRDPKQSLIYAGEMACGDTLNVLNETIKILQQTVSLQEMGFRIELPVGGYDVATDELLDEEIEYAGIAGSLLLSTLKTRGRLHLLWTRNFPNALAGVIASEDPDKRFSVMRKFQRSYDAFIEAEYNVGTSSLEWQRFLDKSIFMLPIVRACVARAQVAAWQPSDAFVAYVSNIYGGFVNSALVEDLVGKERFWENHRSFSGSMSKHRVWHCAQSTGVLGSIHKYNEVRKDDYVFCSGDPTKIPASFYKPQRSDCSLDGADQIIGRCAPSWPHWTPQNMCGQVGDMFVLECLNESKRYDALGLLWRSQLLVSGTVFRYKTETKDSDWRLSLGPLTPGGGPVLVWPLLHLGASGEGTDAVHLFFVDYVDGDRDVSLELAMDWEDIQVLPCSWVPPVSVIQMSGEAYIALKSIGPPMALFRYSLKQAFYDLKLTFVRELATYMLGSSCSRLDMFDLLTQLLDKTWPDVSDDERFEILTRRFHSNHTPALEEELLQSAAAMDTSHESGRLMQEVTDRFSF